MQKCSPELKLKFLVRHEALPTRSTSRGPVWSIIVFFRLTLTVVVTTSQAIQWTRLRLHTSYLFHNSCCSNIPMRNNQDNCVVRKILANIISNHSRVEEEVETVTISECIGVVTVVTLVCSFLRQRKTRTLNLTVVPYSWLCLAESCPTTRRQQDHGPFC